MVQRDPSVSRAENFLSVDGVNKIGVCHFKLKYDEGVAEISVNLNPAARGRGSRRNVST